MFVRANFPISSLKHYTRIWFKPFNGSRSVLSPGHDEVGALLYLKTISLYPRSNPLTKLTNGWYNDTCIATSEIKYGVKNIFEAVLVHILCCWWFIIIIIMNHKQDSILFYNLSHTWHIMLKIGMNELWKMFIRQPGIFLIIVIIYGLINGGWEKNNKNPHVTSVIGPEPVQLEIRAHFAKLKLVSSRQKVEAQLENNILQVFPVNFPFTVDSLYCDSCIHIVYH